ncbi:MAG TPA: CtsR family transcriptional regulator [Thermoclostridium sp.]|nr:CtsR family transcriptional regulator [Thermoclostridium sp.]
MARLSDLIESFLKEMMKDMDGSIEIQRNELANQFNCVPSQINYVISTRFSTDKGYYVESRRGGGGYISIKRLNIESACKYLMHIISSIGDKLSQHTCGIYIQNFIDYDLVNEKEAELMRAATSDKALAAVSPSIRDEVRMDILKNMLISLEI